jgi:thioredoxin
MAASETMSSAVIEVSDRDFQQTVIEQSRRVPVVVDFWAPWCGPCRMIGPVLERLAAEAHGAWILAKLNVDHNPQTASRFGIQGIPAVKGFRNGQVVSEFVGAVPEPQIRRFVDQLVPSAADTMAAEGQRLEAQATWRRLRRPIVTPCTPTPTTRPACWAWAACSSTGPLRRSAGRLAARALRQAGARRGRKLDCQGQLPPASRAQRR